MYIGSEDGKLYALTPNGTQKWTYYGDITDSSPAIGSDGTIYFGSDDGKLHAVNPNGTKKWTYSTGWNIDSSPTIGSDGTIYFGCYENKLYALNPNGTKKWTYTVGDSVELSPAIGSDGTIYIGNYDGNLYAISDITVSTTVKGGLYNTTKTITLKMSQAGKIYYTLNGSTPTSKGTLYAKPIIITSTTTLKYLAIDPTGNKSPVYTQKYTIDKIPPKVTITTPLNKKINVSRTSYITIKFSENINASTNINKITIKNSTGKTIALSKSIKGNTLTIKITKKSANTWYTVTIPKSAIKDPAGNNIAANYSFKFKTGT
ncbi:MAG: PQQ-binding-like beta-propeller repeat protein [Methanobacterium sp. ERen5]|nr:MAG: PQQ-binding-like beta-propeller repeat protein [Methanobacterium sp. ERen5]